MKIDIRISCKIFDFIEISQYSERGILFYRQ